MEIILIVMFVFILIMGFGTIYIKQVPINTLIIVDRKTHYLKTKRFGLYFFNPATDKITTEISLCKVTKSYANYFETNDGKILFAKYTASYHATDLNSVEAALANVRRSVDDIMNSSVYWAVNNLDAKDFTGNLSVFYKEVESKLLSECQELCIVLDSFTFNDARFVPCSSSITTFKPHLSSHSDNPIQFN